MQPHVPIVLLPFSIQTPCGVVYFTKQLVCVSIEKKKNQPEQKFKKEANFCSGWFFFFSIDTPINLDQDGCINRKGKKSARTEVQKGSQLLFWLIFLFFY